MLLTLTLVVEGVVLVAARIVPGSELRRMPVGDVSVDVLLMRPNGTVMPPAIVTFTFASDTCIG